MVLVAFVALTFPAYKALRHIGMIEGHDTEAAVFRAQEFYNALKDGHFPVRWAKRLDYGLGQPTFTFTYTLPYYLTSVFMFLGADGLLAYKLVMMLSFPLGAVGVYLWLKDKLGNWPALTAAVSYAYFPYHFANVYVRGAIGETIALSFLPFSLYALDRLAQNPTWKRTFAAAISIAVVILSHQFYGFIFSGVWLGYGILKKEKKIILATVWGYVLCSFYIIPVFAHRNLTYLKQIGEYFLRTQYFTDIPKLIYSPWGFAAYQELDKDPMSIQIGWFGLLGILALGIAAVKAKKMEMKKEAGYFLGVFLVMLFLMLPVSLPVWKSVSLLQALQFPWRLLGVVSLIASFGVGLLVKQSKTKWFWGSLIIVIVIASSQGYWNVKRYFPYQNPADTSIGYPGTLTMLLEETPIWHDIRQEANPYNFATVTYGNAEAKNVVWKTNYHKLTVLAQSRSIVNDKTHYWPGWEVTVDGKKVDLISPYDQFSLGTLAFWVEPGDHVIESRLSEPWVNKLSNLISLLAGGAGLVIVARQVILSRYAD